MIKDNNLGALVVVVHTISFLLHVWATTGRANIQKINKTEKPLSTTAHFLTFGLSYGQTMNVTEGDFVERIVSFALSYFLISNPSLVVRIQKTTC